MDSCNLVSKELEKVLVKFNQSEKRTEAILDNYLVQLNSLKQSLVSEEQLDDSEQSRVSEWFRQLKESSSTISTEHKDLHAGVSKIGKAIDKNFVSDYSSLTGESPFDSLDDKNSLNHVICDHFLRQGMLDIAETFIQESSLNIEPSQKEPFIELNYILGYLRRKDISPALQWAQFHREKLMQNGSCLEFKLHRLKFIDLMRQGVDKQGEVLAYTKNFTPFAHNHTNELQVLMGSLLFLRQGLENTCYSYLLDPVNWQEICDLFVCDLCRLIGLSTETPLSVVISAGKKALPPLLNINEVMQKKQCSGVWSARDELPVEIDVGADSRFHSLFACPILRQQSSESNPPVRLVCGHVISRDALNKLSTANKVKCPYCPIEQSPADAREIYF